jgi:hypothetical protein
MTVEQLVLLIGLFVLTIGRAVKQLFEQRADERQRAERPPPARFDPPPIVTRPRRSEPLAAPRPPRAVHPRAIDIPVSAPAAASASRRLLRPDLSNLKRAMVLIAVFGPPRADTLRSREPAAPHPER